MEIYGPGTLIANRYEVAGRPQMGGMGIVYFCYDHQEQRPVALKTFRPEYLPDRAARDRFLREGTTWVELGAHPHIVRCFEALQMENTREVYLVLEPITRVQGYADASLRSWLIPARPLPWATALLFALQIARGMAYAATRIPGFVHRDLKPENVLVGADRLAGWAVNRVRVTDFGLATVSGLGHSEVGRWGGSATQAGSSDARRDNQPPASRGQLTHSVVGTPMYMAPEQWQGAQLGVYTDVYALGCILFEMLAGQHAVSIDSSPDLEHAHCSGAIRSLPASVPIAVRRVVARCLALVPAARYGSWVSLSEELAAAVRSVTGHDAPELTRPAALGREERIAVGWSYSEMGWAYLDIDSDALALDYFGRAARIGRAEGDRALECAALGNLGTAHLRLGDVRSAIEFFEQDLRTGREIGDRHGEGTTLNNLGLAYARLGDVNRAIGFHDAALAIATEIGNRHGEGAAQYGLGVAYYALGDARRAIACFGQDLSIAREIGDRSGQGVTLEHMGAALVSLGDAEGAVACFEEHLEIARETGDRSGERRAQANLGLCHRRLGDLPRATEYYNTALAVARDIGDRGGERSALIDLGQVYSARDDQYGAIGCLQGLLEIARETGDRSLEGSALGDLGNAYWRLGDARRAIEFYDQHLGIARELNSRRGEELALGNLGNAHTDLGEVSRAIWYFGQALAIGREIGDDEGVARHTHNMAFLYVKQGELARALPLYQEAAQRWERVDHTQEAQQARNMVAVLQRELAVSSGLSPARTPKQDAPRSYQTAIIVGRLGRDPELRYTEEGTPVAAFSVVATHESADSDGSWDEQVTWFRVTAWHALAIEAARDLRKGDEVFVEGRLAPDAATGGPRVWAGQDGTPHASYEVVAETVIALQRS